MSDCFAIINKSTSKSHSFVKFMPVRSEEEQRSVTRTWYLPRPTGDAYVTHTLDESSTACNVDIEALPDYLSEEELDAFLVESGVVDKLFSRLDAIPPSPNWKAELDEL